MKIYVLGGGISGLAALWRLKKLLPNEEIRLLEKSNRLGGWIETGRTGDFLFEKGPRTFSAARSPSFLQLIAEVGLEEDLVFSLPSAKARYLWHRGRLKNASTLFLPHAWRLFREPFVSRGRVEETIHEFASRRFGAKIADLFFDPLTLGIYAGDSRALSMEASFPRFVEMEKQYGSLLFAMLASRRRKKTFPGSLFTLKAGIGSLVDAMACKLKERILLDQEVLGLKRENGKWRIETKKEEFSADAIFSALPPHALKKLLPEMPDVPSASLTVVNMGFTSLSLPKSGYGYLIPSSEKEPLLGMIFDSEIFGGRKCTLTAMVRPDEVRPKEVALEALRRHLKLSQLPDCIETLLAKEAIPQLGVGQKKALFQWEPSLCNLYLLGNYLEGPGVEQCVARSEKMTKHFFEEKFQN